MDDQQLMDEELGAEIYATGGGIADCENSDQEWGWLVARETAEGIPAQ